MAIRSRHVPRPDSVVSNLFLLFIHLPVQVTWSFPFARRHVWLPMELESNVALSDLLNQGSLQRK